MFLPTRNYSKIFDYFEIDLKSNKICTFVLIDMDYFHTRVSNNEKNNVLNLFSKLIKEDVSLSKVFYTGKDEFILICENKKAEEVLPIIFNLKHQFFNESGITFSAGLVEYPKNGEDHFEILRSLESSLYKAKESGRNHISLGDIEKKKLKTNYYTPVQLSRLATISKKLNRSEASLLREALDELIRKYDE